MLKPLSQPLRLTTRCCFLRSREPAFQSPESQLKTPDDMSNQSYPHHQSDAVPKITSNQKARNRRAEKTKPSSTEQHLASRLPSISLGKTSIFSIMNDNVGIWWGSQRRGEGDGVATRLESPAIPNTLFDLCSVNKHFNTLYLWDVTKDTMWRTKPSAKSNGAYRSNRGCPNGIA